MGFRMQHRNAADTSASGRDRYILLLSKNAGASLGNARGPPHLAVRDGRQAGRCQGERHVLSDGDRRNCRGGAVRGPRWRASS